jgi:hypothetical protein
MTKTEQFIQALQSVPQSVYKDFTDRAKVVALQYPTSFGIDCFARGEGIEYGFLQSVTDYIDLQANDKGQANDPDYLFAGNILTDAKTQCGGLKPQLSGKKLFYANQWDIQKKAQGASEFKSKADCYVLIDPHYARIAVIDSAVFYTKKFTQGSARISFSVKPEEVTMIYDGADSVLDIQVEHDSKAIYRAIWDDAATHV